MARRGGGHPSLRHIGWMAGVSLLVLLGYERVKSGRTPSITTARRPRSGAVRAA